MTGLEYARGEQVFQIDCDLEVAPEALLDFKRRMDETRADVIYGVQSVRKDVWTRRLAANAPAPRSAAVRRRGAGAPRPLSPWTHTCGWTDRRES